MREVSIIKIGGNVVDSPEALENFLHKFNNIPSPKILIHGGGVIASQFSKRMGIEPKMHNGRRITDFETLKIVAMTYAGWVNKSIVAQLQKIGCNAIGLSGADGNCVPAKRRDPKPIDFGYVGDVEPQKINKELIDNLLSNGITPVFCAITHDENGSLLNTNADTMASSIAVALSSLYSVKLIFCFEKNGVLYSADDDNSVIPTITEELFEELREKEIVSAGMLPKLENSFAALNNGVEEVIIKKAENLDIELGTKLILKN